MSRRKKKRTEKIIHYVQLRTHRQYPNVKNYSSHLQTFHHTLQPITYEIDRILNKKWIDLRRNELIEQFNENHQVNIRQEFVERVKIFDKKSTFLQNQFDENNQFIRSIEIIDHLLDLHQQIENNQQENYEYRLSLLKYEFGQERQSLNDLFVHQHFKELDHQIDVLNGLEYEDILQENIRFQLNYRQLEEEFLKDINQLYSEYNTRILSLKSTSNQVRYSINSNDQPFNRIAKRCQHLSEKIHRDKQRLNHETIFIRILRRKIHEQENHWNHLYDELHQVKRCSISSSPSKFRHGSERHFRRLSVLVNRIQKQCQEKLNKVQRIFLLIGQCQRMEFDDEKFPLSIESKTNFNEIISRINYLGNCQWQFDSVFDELNSFWKRLAHVQLDFVIRTKEKSSHKQQQYFLQKQLNILF